jgi:hypothetical protein
MLGNSVHSENKTWKESGKEGGKGEWGRDGGGAEDENKRRRTRHAGIETEEGKEV